jgi:hypothetical protein
MGGAAKVGNQRGGCLRICLVFAGLGPGWGWIFSAFTQKWESVIGKLRQFCWRRDLNLCGTVRAVAWASGFGFGLTGSG